MVHVTGCIDLTEVEDEHFVDLTSNSQTSAESDNGVLLGGNDSSVVVS